MESTRYMFAKRCWTCMCVNGLFTVYDENGRHVATDLSKEVAEAIVNGVNALPQLKRCPHCGDVASFKRDTSEVITTFFVSCSGCECRTRPYNHAETAQTQWNRRVGDEQA